MAPQMRLRAAMAAIGQVGLYLTPMARTGWLAMDGVTEYPKVKYPQFVSMFSGEAWFLPGSTGAMFKLMDVSGLYLLAASPTVAPGAVTGKTGHVMTGDNLPAHKHTENQATATPTPAQKALLSGTILGISLGDVTKPPTTTVAQGETGATGNAVPTAIPLTPKGIAVNVMIFAGVSGL